ncbi:MAG: LysR family transcriptional regulator [Pseudomonadota bacterium]
MNLRDLEYVLAVAKHGQFSQAAAHCNVSQPALSNQIKKLEQQLGGELFLRLPSEVKPSELGERVIQIAGRMINDAQRIKDTATEFRNPEAMPLKIGMTPTLAPYLTKYFSDMFATLFPGMRVTMVEELPDRMTAMVADRDLDTALIARTNHKGNLDFSSIWYEPLYLAISKTHDICRMDEIRAEDVPPQHLIRLPYSFGYALEDELPEPDYTERRKKSYDLSALRFETVCRHVSYSDDCTIVSALAAEQFKQDGWNLNFVPFAGPGNLRDLGVISRPGCPRKSILTKIGTYILQSPPKGVVPTFGIDSMGSCNS